MPFEQEDSKKPRGKYSAAAGRKAKFGGICVSLAASLLMAGCAAQNGAQMQPAGLTAPKKNIGASKHKNGQKAHKKVAYSSRLTERHCLERAMFFESSRSSREGLVAVGTVVMNRVHSSQYPNTICGVVGQKSQFAPGVLSRQVNMAAIPDVAAAAEAVLHGERSPKLRHAMYFHAAGLRFPYNNMRYVMVAGGNSFYEKRGRDGQLSAPINDETYDVAYAFAQDRGEAIPAAAALDGAVAGGGEGMKLASIQHNSARAQLLQTAYRPEAGPENIVRAANASLSSIYDRRGNAESAQENEAEAMPASYVPSPASVPVPRLKAEAVPAAAAVSQARTPHFMPISAPAEENGALREVAGNLGGASVSYKAPAAEKAGEVSNFLQGGRN